MGKSLAISAIILMLVGLSAISGARFFAERELTLAGLIATGSFVLLVLGGKMATSVLRGFRPVLLYWALYFIAAIAIAGTAVRFTLRGYSREDYVIDESNAVMEVLDTEGRTGKFRKVERIRVVDDSPAVFWDRGLGATGEIRNLVIRFPESDIKNQEIQPRAGIYEARTEFLRPTRPGQTFTKITELEVIGGQPEPNVYLIANVTRTIHKVTIEIKVPAQRPCKRVVATSTRNGVDGRTEETPEFLANGTAVRWTKLNPVKGREYVISCDW